MIKGLFTRTEVQAQLSFDLGDSHKSGVMRAMQMFSKRDIEKTRSLEKRGLLTVNRPSRWAKLSR